MQGEIASAFGDLLKQLWAPGATPVAPRTFKLKLSHFAPQFSGFSQHDSQVSVGHFFLQDLNFCQNFNNIVLCIYIHACVLCLNVCMYVNNCKFVFIIHVEDNNCIFLHRSSLLSCWMDSMKI